MRAAGAFAWWDLSLRTNGWKVCGREAGNEKPVARVAVEEAMARDRNGDVFLLGAGFARAISPTMPLLQDLAGRVVKALTPRGRIPDEVRCMMDENFAHALSYLEQAKPWITEADNLRHRALFLDISNAIARDLDETVVRAGDSLGAKAPAWLKPFIRHWHEHRATVLTLNYDTSIETVAATIVVGRGERILARQIYPLLLTDAGLRSGGLRPEKRVESFRLLKLHGSTNWYYSGRALSYGEPLYFVPPAGGGRRRERAPGARAAAACGGGQVSVSCAADL